VNPGFEYYCDQSIEMSEQSETPEIELVSKEANEITDIENWLADNNLSIDQFPYSDDAFTYETEGENNYETYLLSLINLNSGEKVTLDFSEFQYGEKYQEEDYDFIKQRISFAKVQDGILYVATSHNTYAESSPQNAYLTAIDLSDYHVLWKTEPLTCNSYTFAIKENVIICGYGFTSEKDSLKLVDCKTGLIINETAINSKADYIVLKNDKLFVRTYDTNYVFKLTGSDLQSGDSSKQVYQPILDTLTEEQGYSLIKISNLSYPVLLVADGTYEYEKGLNATIYCNGYVFIKQEIVSIGEISSGGTAYPIAYDETGIYTAANDGCSRLILEEQSGELLSFWDEETELTDQYSEAQVVSFE